jgi:hypothetical protein
MRVWSVLASDLAALSQAAQTLLGGGSDAPSDSDGLQGSGDAQLVKLFGQLLASVQFYLRFEIDEQSGQALGDTEVAARHYAKMQRLQRLAFRHLQADCPDLCLRSVAALDSRAELTRLLGALPDPKLRLLCDKLALPVPEPQQTPGACPSLPRTQCLLCPTHALFMCSSHLIYLPALYCPILPFLSPFPFFSSEFMVEVLVNHLERRVSQKQAINDMPLFPDEVRSLCLSLAGLAWLANITSHRTIAVLICAFPASVVRSQPGARRELRR